MDFRNLIKEIEINNSDRISDYKINNHFIWPVIRYSIRKLNYIKDNSSIRGIPKKAVINWNQIKRIKLVISQLLINKTYQKREYEYTFLESTDRRNVEFGDIYNYSIRKNLSNYNIILRPTLDLEANFMMKEKRKKYYSIGFAYIKYFIYLAKNKIIKNKKNNKFLNEICTKYDIDKNYVYDDIAKYFIFYKYYDKLLSKLKVKKIFLYTGYNISNLALVKCANKKNIVTTEIQHGNFTIEDGAYHFYNEKAESFNDFFSSNFLCFSSKFKKILSIDNSYFRDKNIIEIGFPITHMLKPFRKEVNSKMKILLIPKFDFDMLFENFLNLLFLIVKDNSNIEISIRFHPNVINEKLIDFISNKYVYQINMDRSIWSESIVRYDYFIGETSTTLLEAEYIGKKVFLIDTLESRLFGKNMINPQYIIRPTIDLFRPYNWNYETVFNESKDIGSFI